MGDAEVFAYEQELDEMDEWEAMHAHEMEAAEEEMLAMEEAERKLAATAATPAKTAAPATASRDPADAEGSGANGGAGEEEEEEEAERDEAENDSLARAQERLNQVLARCSTLLDEDDDGDERMREETEETDKRLGRRKKPVVAADASVSSYLYDRPPIDVASMPVVLKDGTRMFLRKKIALRADATPAMRRSADASSLVPIERLMDAIQQREIAARIADDDDEMMTELTPETASEPRSTALWLDTYRPHGFIDLLSDERTNREVLSWVKQWDAFVFPHKKQPAASAHPSPQTRKPFAGPSPGGIFGSAAHSQPSGGQEAPSDVVEDKRPHEKIILICGPPGAGKTTLANIVARHAGYNPIEVNASDDRTPDVLKNKIISAMEMQSIFGSRKPNCVILDEIDGAMNGGDGRSAIAAIQEIVAAPLRPKKSGGKAAGRSRHPLTRPLICICNDQFASVLRPLRQMAKIFVMDAPSPQRLISRLKYICRHEGLQRSTGALAALCSSAGNDIRYCVNALQFQSLQPGRHEASAPANGRGSAAAAAFVVGQKDQTRGVMDTMSLVFYQPRSKTSIAPTPASELVADAALGLGNSSLLVNALDENLPSMSFNDPTLRKLCAAFEWLGLADAWDTKVRAEQQFALAAYVPFAAVAVHHACCTSSRRRVAYPRAHFEAQKRLERARNILQALLEASQLHPSMRAGVGVVAVDVVPWLLGILSPGIRHANPSLQSKEEKAMVARLIGVMAALGLSFRPKHMPDGSEDFALEPALHELMRFKLSEGDPVRRATLPPLVRKMIAREVELERMRRSEGGARAASKAADKTAAESGEPAAADAAKPKTVALPTLTEAQQAAKAEAMRRRNPFAFAHREAKRKREREQLAREQQQRQSARSGGDGDGNPTARRSRLRYKFNEGYTSGIKTTVFMRDLL